MSKWDEECLHVGVRVCHFLNSLFLYLLGLQLYNSTGKRTKKKMNTLHSQIARSEYMHYFAN